MFSGFILTSTWNMINHLRLLLLILAVSIEPNYVPIILWIIGFVLGNISYIVEIPYIRYKTGFELKYNITVNLMTQIIMLILIHRIDILWYAIFVYTVLGLLYTICSEVGIEHLYLIYFPTLGLGYVYFVFPNFLFQILVYLDAHEIIIQTQEVLYLFLIIYLSTYIYLGYHLYRIILRRDCVFI